MAPRRRRKPTSKNPYIDSLKGRGLDKSQIVAKLTGTKDNSGGARKLTAGQLRRIGFSQEFVANLKGWDLSGGNTGGGGGGRGGSGGGGNGGGGGTPDAPAWNPAPVDEQLSNNKSAFNLMKSILREYGLESLAGVVENLIQSGVTDQAGITLALQDTKEWKQRFIGNEKLRGAGLPVLSVAEYLATERAYGQIMKNYGLPQGFYDDPADFGDFIGKGVSAAELQERAQSHSDLANRDDPAVKAQLKAMGMSEGDLLAFYMDPERANPLIQRKYKATLIGASARRVGLTADTAYAERLAGMGITEQQAQAGYSLIGENFADVDRLGEIYGTDYDQRDFESEVFEGNAEATKKRKRLASQERAAFEGSSGVQSGSLRRSTGGQY